MRQWNVNRVLQGQHYNADKSSRYRGWSTGGTRLKAGKAAQTTGTPQITTTRAEVWQRHTQETTDLLICILNMIERKRNENNSRSVRTSILASMAIQWSCL